MVGVIVVTLTSRELKLYKSVQEWEEKLHNYEMTDLEVLYDQAIRSSFELLPEDIQKEFFKSLDTMLFHLHAIIQGTQMQHDASERILTSARTFNSDVAEIEDLKLLSIDQLNYIAQQQISRHRLYSFTQGGISGMGGPVLLASDLPAVTVINLRLVQLIAMSYGYNVNTPREMMISLKVFHAGTLPTRMQRMGLAELNEYTRSSHQSYFYEGPEEITDISWIEQPVKQIMKYIAITMFHKKKAQGIPILSMMIGASSNYSLTRRVSEFAHNYYLSRYFQEKIDEQELY